MEEIAQRLGDFLLSAALAFSVVMLGACVLATVLAGFAMVFAHGKVMEIAKDWFWRIVGGLVFSGSATMIVKGLQAKLSGG